MEYLMEENSFVSLHGNGTKDKRREILENITNFCFTCAYERDGETRCINGYLFIPETQCLDLRKEIDILFLFVWQWSF